MAKNCPVGDALIKEASASMLNVVDAHLDKEIGISKEEAAKKHSLAAVAWENHLKGCKVCKGEEGIENL